MFFTAYVLCSLRLFKVKREDQIVYSETMTAKLQNSNQISLFTWISLIGL